MKIMAVQINLYASIQIAILFGFCFCLLLVIEIYFYDCFYYFSS